METSGIDHEDLEFRSVWRRDPYEELRFYWVVSKIMALYGETIPLLPQLRTEDEKEIWRDYCDQLEVFLLEIHQDSFVRGMRHISISAQLYEADQLLYQSRRSPFLTRSFPGRKGNPKLEDWQKGVFSEDYEIYWKNQIAKGYQPGGQKSTKKPKKSTASKTSEPSATKEPVVEQPAVETPVVETPALEKLKVRDIGLAESEKLRPLPEKFAEHAASRIDDLWETTYYNEVLGYKEALQEVLTVAGNMGLKASERSEAIAFLFSKLRGICDRPGGARK
ncbi:hypothetical protein B0T17DRAFT_621426 [Bombardia bombarda]|uniref:Uncharacterized protein n=1 Tax=Bombardia bombarda TaxID=252184 RepID=A0AA39T0W2_9PEZI|nr:hypothetical protein B0T17DRAFT_621426 [Bombardia bombarda]